MNKKTLLLAALALCFTVQLSAQVLYDASGGTTVGRISGNNIMDASGGRTVGRFNGERVMDGSGGYTLNYLKSDGRVMDKSGGYCVGRINQNGRVTDGSGGKTLGYVENGQVWDGSHGRKLGQYSGVSTVQAAYFYFFFNNGKGQQSAQQNKSGNSGQQRVTNALQKPVTKAKQTKVTVIKDRDNVTLGTLYDDDTFVSVSGSGLRFEFKQTEQGLSIIQQGQSIAYIGKDKKTVYVNNGAMVYAIIDQQGNAYYEDGEQYGTIKDDGSVMFSQTLDKPWGFVKGSDYNRQVVALIYFVCYNSILYNAYTEKDKQKAAQEAQKAAQDTQKAATESQKAE